MKPHEIEFLYLSQEDLPRGDFKEYHPVDRHTALAKGDEAVKPENHPSVAP